MLLLYVLDMAATDYVALVYTFVLLVTLSFCYRTSGFCSHAVGLIMTIFTNYYRKIHPQYKN